MEMRGNTTSEGGPSTSEHTTLSAVDAIRSPKLEPGPGTMLDDRYRLQQSIGRGGMGQVFRAYDSRLRRDVAVKLLHPKVAANPERRAMFRREAEIMANLRHPNVVGVHDSGVWGSEPYLVMPFHEASSLRTWAARRGGPPIPPDVAMGLVGQACAGASAMHHEGVIHGDIKPDNILVSEALEVVLVDLGLSRSAAARSDGRLVNGTPGFIAPELIHGDVIEPAQAPKIDVYALGVTAYWLLVGKQPWGAGEGGIELLVRQLEQPFVRPSELRPELGSAFDEPLRAAIHADPVRRPTVDVLREQLLEASRRCNRSKRFIVVIDDDVDMLLLEEAVAATAVEGAEIVGIRDAKAALSIIESRPPDLVITDLQMPRLNGIELTAMLRGKAATASVPVIVVTGVGGADEWRLLHTLGAECLLHKPVRAGILRQTIRHVLEQ